MSVTSIAESLYPIAPLWRRLAAMVYDGLLLIALWFLLAAAYLALFQFFTKGTPKDPLFLQLTLFPLELFATFCFFDYFWRTKGQTLGMLAWKLKLVNSDEGALSRKTTLKRWAVSLISLSCGGLGYWSAIWQAEKLSWHDRVSSTKIVHRK